MKKQIILLVCILFIVNVILLFNFRNTRNSFRTNDRIDMDQTERIEKLEEFYNIKVLPYKDFYHKDYKVCLTCHKLQK